MSHLPRLRALALAGAIVLPLSACGSSDADATATGATATPVTIAHAFGATEVPTDPQRVVTWGWGSADAAIALGVVPVAIGAQAYGGDDEKVLPWVRERLEADGADVPTVLPDTPEPPLEAIAAARPDLILAPYSGITEAEYDKLTAIAPTVAYPREPWATPWRETITIVGEALGRAEQADALLAGIDAEVATAAAAHPELQGKSVALVASTPDTFYVYKPADPRVEFTLDLGLEGAESVETLSDGEESFFYTLSTERLGELDSDVLVSYAATPEEQQAFLSSPQAQLLDQVQRGAVAQVTGSSLVASVSPPTALSLTWGLEDYLAALSKAAANA